MVMTREQIEAALDRPPQVQLVEIPELGAGEAVYVRTVTGIEADEFNGTLRPAGPDGPVHTANITARYAALFLSDEHGKPLYRLADAQRLGRLDYRALGRIYAAGMALNGMTAEAAEETEKNS